MPGKSRLPDYESLTRPRSSQVSKTGAVELNAGTSPRLRPVRSASSLAKEINTEVNQAPRAAVISKGSLNSRRTASLDHGVDFSQADVKQGGLSKHTFLRNGHALTYAALFLFTIILYARPA